MDVRLQVHGDGKEKTYSILRLADIPIVRYIKVKADANPFDPAWDEYFAKRAERSNRQRKTKGHVMPKQPKRPFIGFSAGTKSVQVPVRVHETIT